MSDGSPASAGSLAERLALLAHEVRSPVAALVAIASAYPGAAPVERRRLLELARAAGGGIERLLLEASVASVRLAAVDPGELARAAAETAALAGLRVRAAVGDDVPPIRGDPLRLRQALDNLIANAAGHSPRGSEILVGARRDGERVLLSVSDTGEGMPSWELGRVFEPGVRLTTRRPGSGLGLAVVAEIARAHGGSVEVESEPGRGATFTIALPLASPGSG